MRLPICAWLLLSVVGCGGNGPEPVAPDPEPPVDAPPATPGAQRPSLTAAECEAKGGSVVGDIGDGAIHRPDYHCASGKPPLGSVSAPAGGPVAVEGSVCCPS